MFILCRSDMIGGFIDKMIKISTIRGCCKLMAQNLTHAFQNLILPN